MFARISRYSPAVRGIRGPPRIRTTVQNGRRRHVSSSPGSSSGRRIELSSGLLIREFGVRVPGGAPEPGGLHVSGGCAFTFGLGPSARLSRAKTRADVPRVSASASAWGNFPGRFRGIQRMAPHRLHRTRQARQSCRPPDARRRPPPPRLSPNPHKPRPHRPASPRDSMNVTLYRKEWAQSDIHRIPRPSAPARMGPIRRECTCLGGAGRAGRATRQPRAGL
jgi:hypothetical protein